MSGTWAVVRLDVRRERVALAAWVLGLGLLVATTFPAIARLYPTASERASLAASIGANPATVAITGPILSDSVGGLSAWRIGVLGGTGVALMALLTVIRRTRAEEESGRAELLMATALGRSAPLLAALLTITLAGLAVGGLSLVAALASGLPVTGSLTMAGSLVGSGLVFGAVAAVAAQLSASARVATWIAGSVLGAAFLLRAAADTVDGLNWLRWLSPLGWITEIGPFAADRWWVLLLYPTAAVVLVLVALGLQGRRDVGAGLWPARSGPAVGRLGSAGALLTRLVRGSMLGWWIALVVAGAVFGGVAADADQLLAGNPQVTRYFRDIGGSGGLTSVLLGTLAAIAGLAVSGQGIAVVMRWRAEETSGRLGPVLAAPVGRGRPLAAVTVWALLAPAGSLLIGGLAAGLSLGARSGGMESALGAAVVAMAVQIPAVWVLVGVAIALLGGWPGGLGLAWAALGAALLLGQIGALLHLPQGVLDLSPFTHIPVGDVRWTPLLVLTGVAAALVAAGFVGYLRRDLSV